MIRGQKKEFDRASQAFVDSLIKEIIQPGVDQLTALADFIELRSGTLSVKRLQGWALQHHIRTGEGRKIGALE
jgi:hypothetical protein